MSKTLYILICNGGDGSYHNIFTINKDWIDRQQERYDNEESDYESDPGIDGDGFHYSTIQVPDDATYESLGISKWCVAENEY